MYKLKPFHWIVCQVSFCFLMLQVVNMLLYKWYKMVSTDCLFCMCLLRSEQWWHLFLLRVSQWTVDWLNHTHSHHDVYHQGSSLVSRSLFSITCMVIYWDFQHSMHLSCKKHVRHVYWCYYYETWLDSLCTNQLQNEKVHLDPSIIYFYFLIYMV